MVDGLDLVLSKIDLKCPSTLICWRKREEAMWKGQDGRQRKDIAIEHNGIVDADWMVKV